MTRASTTKRTRAPARILEGNALRLERDLILLFAAVRDHPAKLLKSGAPSKTFFTRLREMFKDVSADAEIDGYILFLLGISRAAGLLHERDEHLHPNTLAIDVFFAEAPSARLDKLRQAWLDAGEFNEFVLVPSLEFAAKRDSATLDICDVVPGAARMRDIRRSVLAHVEKLEAGRWMRSDDFSDEISRAQPGLLIPNTGAGRFAAQKFYTGVRVKGDKHELPREGNWPLVEGALIGMLLRSPLLLLGYVDIGVDDEGEGFAFRLRGADTALADDTESKQPFALQANFEVLAFVPEMTPATLWAITRYCSVVSFADVATLKIEERHIAHAINEGGSFTGIVAFLESRSKTGLPQNVRYSIENWAQKAERVAIYLDACLFEAEGNEDLSKLVREPYRKRAALAPLAERHLVGSSNATPDPREGIAPRYPVLDYSRALAPVLRASDDGLLSCQSEQANFRIVQVLARIAKQESLERWRITRETFGEAVRKGLPPERAIELLRSIVAHELPAALLLKLQGWAGRLEPVILRRTALLEFQQAEAVELLRASAASRNLPMRVLNATTVEVEADELDKVRAVLADLAIPVVEDSHS